MMSMIELLFEAKEEVVTLRRQNELLRARVDTMDLLAGFLHAQIPSRSVGMAEDVAWKLQKEIDSLKANEASNAK